MEFGLKQSLFSDTTLTLPVPKQTDHAVLSGRASNTKYLIGLGALGKVNKWTGLLTSSRIDQKQAMQVYGQFFPCIEWSGFFYGIPPAEQLKAYNKVLPEGFEFVGKLPQTITHLKRLVGIEQDLQAFFGGVAPLGSRLSSLLILPHPKITTLQPIRQFIQLLRGVPYQLMLEVRDERWFKDGGLDQELYELMVDNSVTAVISDTIGRRDAIHMRLTTKNTYIRFNCSGDRDVDHSRLNEWVDRLKLWQDHGLERCYFIVHADESRDGAIVAKYLIDRLNQVCCTSLSLNLLS